MFHWMSWRKRGGPFPLVLCNCLCFTTPFIRREVTPHVLDGVVGVKDERREVSTNAHCSKVRRQSTPQIAKGQAVRVLFVVLVMVIYPWVFKGPGGGAFQGFSHEIFRFARSIKESCPSLH